MLKLVAFSLVLCTINADVSHILAKYKNLPPGSPIPILRQDQDIREDGSYSYYYETGNGIVGHEDGSPVPSNEVDRSVTGGFHYTSPEGKLIVISYVANGDGFQASGDAVPTIPPAILRSLEYNAAHPTN